MKHAARAIPVLAGILAAVLAGCAARVPPPDDIQLTRRSATADDWSRHLPVLYRGLSACLAAAPAPPPRPAERRAGQDDVRPCISLGAAHHHKTTNQHSKKP